MSLLTYLIDARVRDARAELDGKVLTRPMLSVTDGINLTYGCDVDIGVVSQIGYDQNGDLDLIDDFTGRLVKATILRNVPIARGNTEVIYAEVGSAVRLRRTSSGRYEIVGFSKQAPGTNVRIPVNLVDFTLGALIDLTLTARPLTYAELDTFGGYGVVPYGAAALYRGTTLLEIKT